MIYNLSRAEGTTATGEFIFTTPDYEWIKLDTEYGLFAKFAYKTVFIPINAIIRLTYEEASTPRTTIG